MDAQQLRTITPAANEVLAAPASLAIEAERPVTERTAESGVRVFDRRNALVRGRVTLSNDGRRIEWRPSRALKAGAYRLSVEELATPDGDRIDERLDVPFAIVDSKVALPDDVEIHAYRVVAPVVGTTDHRPVADRARGESVTLIKAFDRKSGEPVDLAFDRTGKRVDFEAIQRKAGEAHAKRHGKVTPALARMMAGVAGPKGGRKRAGDEGSRIRVAIWLVAPGDDEADRAKLAFVEPGGDDRRQDDVGRGPEPVRAERSERVAQAVSRFTESTEKLLGDVRVRADRLAPVVYAELSTRQIRALAKDEAVAAIFPYDPRGIDDLANSLAISEATVPQAAGTTGRGVRVAVWELGPDQTGDLAIAGFYDTNQSQMSQHARMTNGIIKNTSSTEPNGYAPDCDLYSANDRDIDALAWAAGEGCTVISQSFHRPDEQTDPGLSFDDIYKDWLILRSPWPTIVQASGNGADTEFVNHKGFNSLAVGNHDDSATGLSGDTVFNNPDSTHGDRELPEICANGTGVTVLGPTSSGTSFAAPAVAGTAALIQSADRVLRSWPEGTRAILLAGARRNVSDGLWWPDVLAGVDGSDGSGALNARASVDIANRRTGRDTAGTQRGYDIGRFEAGDFGADRFLNWSYNLRVPPSNWPIVLFPTYKAKAVFAWNSTIDKLRILGIELDYPIGSHLGVDVDLEIYNSRGTLVAGSWSWDNSYEIAEWTAVPGETYRIRPRRWSGRDASWFGIAWTAIPVFRPIFEIDAISLRQLQEVVAGEG